MATLLIGAELGKGVASMVYQLSQSGDIDYASHTKQVQKMIQKEDCAGNDLDHMKGIVKEITVTQKLSKAILRGHWQATASADETSTDDERKPWHHIPVYHEDRCGHLQRSRQQHLWK